MTLILSGRPFERHDFGHFERLRIGRSEECEVRIENLGISRVHCEIVSKGGLYQLRDRGSGNGTIVNGVRVKRHNLNDGDVITIGKFTIDFASTAPWVDAGGGGRSDAGLPTIGVEKEDYAQAREDSRSLVRGYLTSLAPEPGTIVLDKSRYLFGKEPTAEFKLKGWTAPRLAAVLIRDESGFRILDVSSKCDAVFINGKKHKHVRLEQDDELVVREHTLKFSHGVPEGAES